MNNKNFTEKQFERMEEYILSLEVIFDMRKTLIEKYPLITDEQQRRYIEANEILIDAEYKIWKQIKMK